LAERRSWLDVVLELRVQPESSSCCGVRAAPLATARGVAYVAEPFRSIRGCSDSLVRRGSSELGADRRHRDGSGHVARKRLLSMSGRVFGTHTIAP
jgi:hypothetical protein